MNMLSWVFGSEGAQPVTTKSTELGNVGRGGVDAFAFSGMQGWRSRMEDAHLACTEIPVEGWNGRTLKDHFIFGVFDGHGGGLTSDYASKNFISILAKNPSLKQYASMKSPEQKNVPGVQLLRAAFKETFCTLDEEVRKKQVETNGMDSPWNSSDPEKATANRIRMERSGSTIVMVMLTPSHIICANAGDSRAILQRGGRVLPLSFDHKPSNVPEMERIKDAGGFVKSKRIDGDLALSRGLGDFWYKNNQGMPVRGQKVIPHPELVVYPRDFKNDEFVVIACDGIWDVTTNKECADFVDSFLTQEGPDLGRICETALDTCLEKKSRDNMTIGVITFDAAKSLPRTRRERSNEVKEKEVVDFTAASMGTGTERVARKAVSSR